MPKDEPFEPDPLAIDQKDRDLFDFFDDRLAKHHKFNAEPLSSAAGYRYRWGRRIDRSQLARLYARRANKRWKDEIVKRARLAARIARSRELEIAEADYQRRAEALKGVREEDLDAVLEGLRQGLTPEMARNRSGDDLGVAEAASENRADNAGASNTADRYADWPEGSSDEGLAFEIGHPIELIDVTREVEVKEVVQRVLPAQPIEEPPEPEIPKYKRRTAHRNQLGAIRGSYKFKARQDRLNVFVEVKTVLRRIKQIKQKHQQGLGLPRVFNRIRRQALEISKRKAVLNATLEDYKVALERDVWLGGGIGKDGVASARVHLPAKVEKLEIKKHGMRVNWARRKVAAAEEGLDALIERWYAKDKARWIKRVDRAWLLSLNEREDEIEMKRRKKEEDVLERLIKEAMDSDL